MTPVVRCGRCGQSWASEVWLDLPALRTLTARDLDGRVSAWPAGVVVQVRACTRCGETVARGVREAGGSVGP